MTALTHTNNPVRMVYTSLWETLLGSSQFTTVVDGTTNRIRQDGTTVYYGKDAVSGADLPQVRIVLAGQDPHLEATSCDSFLDITWEIQMATGDMRFVDILDVEWSVYCALRGWHDTVAALTWKGKTFAHLCRPEKGAESIDERKISPGNRGWVAVWRGVVRMHFTTDDLDTAAAS